jgi:hypothetical protein
VWISTNVHSAGCSQRRDPRTAFALATQLARAELIQRATETLAEWAERDRQPRERRRQLRKRQALSGLPLFPRPPFRRVPARGTRPCLSFPGRTRSAERVRRNRQPSHAQSRVEHTSAVGFDLSAVADHTPRFSAAAACVNILAPPATSRRGLFASLHRGRFLSSGNASSRGAFTRVAGSGGVC